MGSVWKRRIGGPDGGSDPGSKGSGVVVAVSVALALGAGGTTAGSAISAGGSPSASSPASGSARGGSRVGSRDSVAAQARLVARGIRMKARYSHDASDCAAHAYGQVQKFLRLHPCAGLHRAQFEVRDSNGDVALIAASWVEMSTEEQARSLKQLLDRPGTGNIVELSREKGSYRSVRYTGQFYASRRDGTVVANAQAEPVARGWAGLALATVVTTVVG